jgi:SHAQKYF class myb-like DNA-binding protein
MKKLFVIHTINNKNKKENKEVLCNNDKKALDNNHTPLKLSEDELNMSNSAANTTINGSEDSRKSLNFLTEETSSFNISTLSNKNEENFKKNEFLGKKMKLHFDIVKDKSENTTNSSSLILDNTLNKKTEENDDLDENDSKSVKQMKSSNKKKTCYNEGRWSLEEHRKFIEAIAEYRKNWKNIQMYIGTRSSSQVRSHAQKFLLKLKMSENPNLNLDFKTKEIKNLNDVIEEIINRKQNNDEEKKYIIDYLMNLSLTLSNENSRSTLNSKKNKITKDSSKIFKSQINNNICEDNKKEIISNNNEIKINSSNGKSLEEIKADREIKLNNLPNNISEKKEEIENINKNNSITETSSDLLFKDNNSITERQPILDNYNDYFCHPNKKLVFDDGMAFYADDSEFFNYNNISLRIKDYYYNINFESPSIINKYFFS